ncbi:MAG: OmpA family protein [Bacteroidota bacterium]
MKTLVIFTIVLLSFVTQAQENNPECTGGMPTFFTVLDGFYIEYCKDSEFGSYNFELFGASQIVEKKGHYREFRFAKKANATRKVSGLQVIENHKQAILKVGGTVVDEKVFKTTYRGHETWIHVTPYSGNPDVVNFGIITVEVMEMNQEVSAKDIQGSIGSQGKVALYGILFDTGKADIKPGSEKAIQEIANYLKENAKVGIYVVGHTDNAGDFGANIKLSKARAEALKNYLMAKHNISATRLSADGVASLCPVASNDTEDGRKMNRRVEIVKK